jgi:hypothetical protein
MRLAARLRRKFTIATLVLGMMSNTSTSQADNWDMYLTVDNQFNAYFGTATTTNFFAGSGNNFMTTYHFTALGRAPTDYFYVVSVSDQDIAQGFIGIFANTTTNKSVQTGSVVWQVFPAGAYAATNPFHPNPWPPSQMPTQVQVNTAIAYATANNLWVAPTSLPSYTNGSPPWGLRANIPTSAKWIWYNTGDGPNPSNPFEPGFNHDEFLVFRVAGAIPTQPIVIVDSIPGAFVDISATGTVLNLADDAEAVINTTIGNAVFPAGSVVVGNNGGLGFPSVAGQDDLAPLNAAIPSNTAFSGRQTAMPYWDDLKGDDFFAAGEAPRGGKNGSVQWKEISNVLIVQWTNRPVVGTQRVNGTVRFQAQIFGGVAIAPGAIYAQYLYDDINQATPNGGASATIGFQGGYSGFSDFQWSFNTAGAVSNGNVLTATSPATPPSNAFPAVSDVGQVVLVLLFLTAGAVVFRRGRRAASA